MGPESKTKKCHFCYSFHIYIYIYIYFLLLCSYKSCLRKSAKSMFHQAQRHENHGNNDPFWIAF